MRTRRRPPRLARLLLRWLLPRDAREGVIGDLDEEFARFDRRRTWYWSQAGRSILHASRTRDVMADPPRATGAAIASVTADLRYAVRTLSASPGHTVAAVLTLVLGMGAATAIFSAVNEVMLRPLPFPDPDRLVMLWESNEARGWHQVHAAPANVLDWTRRTSSFTDIAFVSDSTSDVTLDGREGPAQVVMSQVSGNALALLGVPPLHGRTFRDDETFEEGLVVLGYGVWQRHFGADPAVVGSTVRLDGRPYQVVGVMPRRFRYAINDAEVWVTMAWLANRRDSIWFRQAHVVRPIARLRPGVSVDQAAAELASVAADLEREHPDTNRGMQAGLTPLQGFLVGDRRSTLLLLASAVGVLLLVACANVANLTLTRAVGRRRELAVRAALGAARVRLARLLLVESLVLAGAGTVLGLAAGAVGLRAIAAVSPPELDGLVFRIDWRLGAFTVAVCVLSAVLSGTWPAWRGVRAGNTTNLSGGGRTHTPGRRRLLAANGLAALEVALAVLLVAAAGLMVRTLDHLRRVDPGVDMERILTFQLQPPSGAYGNSRARIELGLDLVNAIEALPGVEAAGITRGLPLTGYQWTSDFTIQDWEPGRAGMDLRHREVTPGYFETLGVPVVSGRMFTNQDIVPGRPVPVVVNQAFAERYFPADTPVGRRIAFDRDATEDSYWYDIVGVVGNERMSLRDEPAPEVIAHLVADTPATFSFAVRTAIPPLDLVGSVRSAVAAVEPDMPLLRVRTMDQVAVDARASDRFLMLLMVVFAVCTSLLAVVGVYGVASQAARARTREVGIRLALGAPVSSIVRVLAMRGLGFLGVGLGAGVAGTLAGSRVLQSKLYEVDAKDPLTLVTVVALLALVGLTATLLPTREAARIDPVRVLRAE